MNKYKAVIGLEMHCEMNCNTKVFSSAKNDFSEIPNINVRPVDMGFPGTLPTVNKEAIKKAIMAALILNCRYLNLCILIERNIIIQIYLKDIKLPKCIIQSVLMEK